MAYTSAVSPLGYIGSSGTQSVLPKFLWS